MSVVDCSTPDLFSHSRTVEQYVVTPSGKAMSERVIRLKCQCTFDERYGLARPFGHRRVSMGECLQHQVVSIEAVGPLSFGTLDLSLAHARLDRSHNAQGDLVLDSENIIERPIVTLGPKVRAALRLNKLTRETYPVCGFAHAAFQHITHAEFAADLLHVDGSAFIGER